ncbi:MAG: exo-alpha-sialidase [Chloroflexi bacterium]|nr:exo-alpha-sialidase [Chloroflexota bacterium]
MSSHTVKIQQVEHSQIAGGPEIFCAWPWTGGVHNFGNGEIVIAYTEKPCAYQKYEDVQHGEHLARLVLCRTLDGGASWPESLRLVLRDNRVPFDQWIVQSSYDAGPIDISAPESMLIFWRSFSRDPWQTADGRVAYRPISFAMRSTDRGYHWHLPAVVVPHYHMDSIYGGTNYLKMPDGSLLAAFGGYRYAPGTGKKVDVQALAEAERAPQDEGQRRPSRCVLYISNDQGQHWYYFSTIAYEERDDMDCAYPVLLRLPDGRLLCTVGYRIVRSSQASTSWTSVTFSDDNGRTWTSPRRINDLGDQANLCHLHDGRILCIYGYRFVPFGLRGIVSTDDGQTWSQEFVIRADGAGPDLGYPVITQLPDGRLLAVYYFNVRDELDPHLFYGGRRFIACSTFRLE